MGMTRNQADPMPLLGFYLGVVQRGQMVDTVRAIATIQREHGERRNRRQARWKYTIRRIGADAVRVMLRERFGIALSDAEAKPLPTVRDHLGWHREAGGGERLYAGVMIPSGRVRDESKARYRSAIRGIVDEIPGIGIRVTPTQPLIPSPFPPARPA